jgi:hypothetical protein
MHRFAITDMMVHDLSLHEITHEQTTLLMREPQLAILLAPTCVITSYTPAPGELTQSDVMEEYYDVLVPIHGIPTSRGAWGHGCAPYGV